MPSKEDISEFFKNLQDEICVAVENEDGLAKFKEDLWEREAGGGGRTRILSNGNVIEKGGVNYSAVFGEMPDNILKALSIEKSDFYATGVSIVMHPKNPHVPIIHMNVRYFEMQNGVWWFGGGIDLTPHYVIPQQAQWFHAKLKQVCDAHDASYYQHHKNWADDYFFIKHRKETRGVGGIFFDRMNTDKQKNFEYVKSVGKSFSEIYTHLMNINKNKTFRESEKEWQLLRRGRYVEFNLVYDKGTKFGLDTDGRIESILMSLPELASWKYNFQPEQNSAENQTLNYLKKGIDWINV